MAPAYCVKNILAPRAMMVIFNWNIIARGASLLCKKYSGAASYDGNFKYKTIARGASLLCQKYSGAVSYDGNN